MYIISIFTYCIYCVLYAYDIGIYNILVFSRYVLYSIL